MTTPAFSAITSAINQRADIEQYARATVRSRPDAIDFCHACCMLLDAAQAKGATITLAEESTWQTLLTLTGAARRRYIEALDNEQIGVAVGILANSLRALLNYGCTFSVRMPEAAQAEPLKVAIVEQPETIATHRVIRDQLGHITSTVTTTTSS